MCAIFGITTRSLTFLFEIIVSFHFSPNDKNKMVVPQPKYGERRLVVNCSKAKMDKNVGAPITTRGHNVHESLRHR